MTRSSAACLFTLLLAAASSQSGLRADDDSYLLRYHFRQGEQVRTKVTHVATTETKIRGNTQESKSRTVSTKLWRITDVDDQGNMTFEHVVTDINMWQKVTGRPEIRYDSASDEQPPVQFENAAGTVGKVMAVVKISPTGEILERKSNVPEFDLGLGPIATPLPEQKVAVGDRWNLPSEVTVPLREGKVKRVRTRQSFQLLSVKTGVATISMQTQVLTPVKDPEIEAYLMQQLTNGTIKFDLDQGRVIGKQIDWDETVIGFNGADSLMEYLARFTEEEVRERRTSNVERSTSK